MTKTIMTHLVCGYPSIKESHELLEILSKHSKYIEVQIPFSDPIADGPVITNANEVALKNWVTPNICFYFLEKFIKENSPCHPKWNEGSLFHENGNEISLRDSSLLSEWQHKTKLLIMTYYNIVYNYWVEKFVKKAKKIWIYGFIIPDIPFDEAEWKELINLCKKYDINLIQVVSPVCDKDRLKKIFSLSTWFVYAVSQNMTTWNKIDAWRDFENYIKNLKKLKDIEIWVWFWVKTKEDIEKVCKIANFAIIWSELIRIINNDWTVWVKKYFENF